jgi:hypothetical protein
LRTYSHNENADLLGSAFVTIASENLGFVEGLQTLSAYTEPARLPIYYHSALGNVGAKLAVGAALRKAHIVPELRTLATNFTLSHWNHLFTK